MSIFSNTNIVAGASGKQRGYTIEESLRFNASQSSYLSWTPASAGNRKTFTYSCWTKRGLINTAAHTFGITAASSGNSARNEMEFDGTANEINIGFNPTGSAWFESFTNAVFRDPSAWYHIVVSVDMTQATDTNRLKVYVNGVSQTFRVYSIPTQNTDLPINNNTLTHSIGRYQAGGTSLLDGYLTEVNFIDGQALDHSSFGEYDNVTGVWKPAEYTGSYGTNGFYLPMQLDNTVEGFNTVTYVGNGSTQKITGVGFSPDLVWIKNRTSTYNHVLCNTVSGTELYLSSSTTDAEGAASSAVTSFDQDGYTIGSIAGGNRAGDQIVAWCWDAGDTTVSNTDGSITSSVRANPAYGFSIVKYTATGTAGTVGHGLGVVPQMIIVKHAGQAGTIWPVYTAVVGNTKYLRLNATNAETTDSNSWNNTTPTSTVFSVGNNAADTNNTSGGTTIAYCFSEIAGYSKFGSYTGTGASGNAVTTGFRPAFVTIKRTDSADNWRTYDSTRDIEGAVLYPNLSDVEDAAGHLEFTDTGWTWLGSNSNASGGTYIYMAFKDTREYAYWLDDSGNNNDWQPNGGITTSSTVTDTPTPYEDGGNYAVLNPLSLTSAGGSLSGGNLTLQTTTGTPHVIATATMAIKTKSYCEFTIASSLGSAVGPMVIDLNQPSTSSSNAVLYIAGGTVYTPDGNTGYPSFTNGDTIGIAYNPTTKKVWFSKNNTWISGDPVAGTGGFTNSVFSSNVTFAFDDETSSYAATVYANFGQRPFAYTPPTGFKPLHTGNLPDSEIVDGSEYFNAVLWTGNGGTQSITGVGFQPDFVWAKKRSGAESHNLFDVVRGSPSNFKTLQTNTTGAEITPGTTMMSSLDSGGFTLGSNGGVNESGFTFVAWNWKANGAGVSNTDGSITSTVSASPTAGFSVVTYTGNATNGATVGHGLGVSPSMIIGKIRSTTGDWYVWQTAMGDNFMRLNTTAAQVASTGNGVYNTGSFSSTVFALGSGSSMNTSGGTYVAYCFSEVEGYSKFGSYTGNGSTDGVFVYLGFRARYLLIKETGNANSWEVYDTARNTSNVQTQRLFANDSQTEATTNPSLDIISNGFKCRAGNTGINRSGGTYIYMAFAENPFKNALAR
jgi:hypothetical protein